MNSNLNEFYFETIMIKNRTHSHLEEENMTLKRILVYAPISLVDEILMNVFLVLDLFPQFQKIYFPAQSFNNGVLLLL